MDDLARLQRNWDRLGRTDPLWAVLSWADKKGNRWDERQFFETGERLVSGVFGRLDELECAPARGRALDFGCGVGRLTRALAKRFDETVGVDIAPSMVEMAARLNGETGATFVLNPRPDLSLLADASYDFALSFVTLQHIPKASALRYVSEIVRVLRPGGIGVIQAPSSVARSPAGLMTAVVPAVIRASIRSMEMHAIPREEMIAAIASRGGSVITIDQDVAAGPRWLSLRYYLRK
jgi:SAM-dependent methyltransferase